MCNESQTLQMPDGQRGTLREVQLLCGGVPWVFARTIIPYKTQTGRERRLAHLGNRPLGAVLFADKTMRRGPVEVACLQKGDAMYDQATRSLSPRPASIWGRRSVFYLHDKPLLVSEVFLPRIIRCNCR
jgi:chorismate--pyruvate lyase